MLPWQPSSSSILFLIHAAMLLFLSSSRDIPGLINCHPPLLSAIRQAGKWLLFPPVACLILSRLQQLVKFTFYALSWCFYQDRLIINGDSKLSQHLWISVILHQVIRILGERRFESDFVPFCLMLWNGNTVGLFSGTGSWRRRLFIHKMYRNCLYSYTYGTFSKVSC